MFSHQYNYIDVTDINQLYFDLVGVIRFPSLEVI